VAGLNAGYEALAKRNGLDPAAASAWISKNYGDTAKTVLARHWASKDARVWSPLLREFKASRSRG
jgi:hypothetical protein